MTPMPPGPAAVAMAAMVSVGKVVRTQLLDWRTKHERQAFVQASIAMTLLALFSHPRVGWSAASHNRACTPAYLLLASMRLVITNC